MEKTKDFEQRALAAKLKAARKSLKLTQEALAEKVDLSVQAIKVIEQGKTWPRIETIRKLAAALGMEPRDLLQEKRIEIPEITADQAFGYFQNLQTNLSREIQRNADLDDELHEAKRVNADLQIQFMKLQNESRPPIPPQQEELLRRFDRADELRRSIALDILEGGEENLQALVERLRKLAKKA